MANPFPLLVRWLDENSDTSTVLVNVRREAGDGEIDWPAHLRAAQLLLEAEAFARTRQHWDMQEEVFRNAARLVFQPNAAWAQHPAQEVQTLPEVRRVFMLMGDMWEYESGTGSTPALTDETLNTLRVSLEEIRAGIAIIPREFQEERKHLERVIQICLDLLDADTVDPDLVRSRVNETVGEACAVVEKLPKDERQGFINRLVTISAAVNRYIANAGAQGVIGNGASWAVGQITGAGS